MAAHVKEREGHDGDYRKASLGCESDSAYVTREFQFIQVGKKKNSSALDSR